MAATINASTSSGIVTSADNSGQLELQTANTTRLTINSSGDVGIGTTSITDKLTVAGSVIVSSGSQYKFGTGGVRIVGDTTTDYMAFLTNSGTERMRIDSSGNVGIGTSSPSSRLHIRQDQDGTTRSIIQNRNATGTPISELSFITGSFDLSDNRYAYIQSAGTSNTYIAFGTGNGTTPAERMRITSNGGVSFGSSGTAYGTSGQVLQSNGNAPPTWVAPGFNNIDVLTTTGPGTWTSPPTTTKIKVTVVGGGGGTTTSPTNLGAAGGGGAAIRIFSVSAATGYAYTVGAGGPAGGTGGTSSFGPVGGTTITATGGAAGSPGPTTSFAAGGVGGTGSNGTLNITGQTGGASKAPNVFIGMGGNSIFGGGGSSNPASTAATTYGGGAAGGVGPVSGATAGFQGIIIVEY